MNATTIEWTDRTWNPVTGCTKVSPGCDNCYAENIAHRFAGSKAFPAGFDVTVRADRLDDPLKWRKPSRVFVNSMSDLFHDSVPEEHIFAVFARMWWVPRHTFQVLTKRHGRMRSMMPRIEEHLRQMEQDLACVDMPTQLKWPLPNVWLGVLAENQRWADIRVPALMETPAAVRFLSCEPLLAPVDLTRWLRPVPDCGHVDQLDGTCRHPDAHTPECHRWADCPVRRRPDDWGGLDWVIAGGESGPRARPMHPAWARTLRDDCDVAGVPFFFKQWGEFLTAAVEDDPAFAGGRAYDSPLGGRRSTTIRERGTSFRPGLDQPMRPGDRTSRTVMLDADTIAVRVGKKRAGRLLDGRTHDAFPRDDYRDSMTSGHLEDLDAYSRRLEAAHTNTTRSAR
ncbi:MAG TPA: phage Gp37/Gp68 family protein [Streptomyces sp.]|nr:phage Gp37/Gp68 family protein [Streptomyces sp.]